MSLLRRWSGWQGIKVSLITHALEKVQGALKTSPRVVVLQVNVLQGGDQRTANSPLQLGQIRSGAFLLSREPQVFC